MENRPARYDNEDGYFYDSEGIRYRFDINKLGRFLFDFARFTFKFNSMFRVWKYDCLLDMFGIIFVKVSDEEKARIDNPKCVEDFKGIANKRPVLDTKDKDKDKVEDKGLDTKSNITESSLESDIVGNKSIKGFKQNKGN